MCRIYHYRFVCLIFTSMLRQPVVRKLNPDKHYIFCAREHRPNDIFKVKCGVGNMMRWDSVRFLIEEHIGLHNSKKQNQVVVGRYIEEIDGWFDEGDILTPQTILRIRCVPYYYQFDYNPDRPRSCPQHGPVYYPPPILVQYQQAGIDISSLN
jgi:hypothetical protein